MANSQESDSNEPRFGDLITLQEAAAVSGLSYSHVRYLARTGALDARKLGRDWFTTKQAVNEYLARDRRPGPKSSKGTGSGDSND
jgi:excisionase family DNA binding protein